MILFEYQEFFDDDRTWSALFVKTDDKDWHMAEPNYGTEDESEIRMLIRNTKFCNTILDSFIAFLKTKGTELVYKTPEYITNLYSPWGWQQLPDNLKYLKKVKIFSLFLPKSKFLV